MSIIRSTLLFIGLIFTALLLTSCGGGGGGSNDEPPSDNPASITSNIIVTTPNMQIGSTDNYVLASVEHKTSLESFSVIGGLDQNNSPATINTIFYISADDSVLEITVGKDGYPSSYTDDSGNTVNFINHTDQSMDALVYDSNGILISGPITIDSTFGEIPRISFIATRNAAKNIKYSAKGVSVADVDIDKWVARTVEFFKNTACAAEMLASWNVSACNTTILRELGNLTGIPLDNLVNIIDTLDCLLVNKRTCVLLIFNQLKYSETGNFSEFKPQGLLTEPRNGEVILRWPEVPDAVSYTVYFKASEDLSYESQPRITSQFYIDRNLQNLQQYQYYIVAVNGRGESSLTSDIVRATPFITISPAPTMLPVKSIDDHRVTLEWSSVENVQIYNVYYGEKAGIDKFGWEKQDFTFFNTTTLYLPDSSTTYYFAVTAVIEGESEMSNIVTATTLDVPPPPPPDPPSSSVKLYGIIIGDQAYLNWWFSNEATSYNIYWGSDQEQPLDQRQKETLSLYQLQKIFNGDDLPLGIEHHFIVTPVNESGEGPPSNEVSITIPDTTLSAPTLLQPVPGDSNATLTWLNGVGATCYNVYWGSTPGQGPSIHDAWLSCVGSPVTVSNLVNGVSYYFTVTSNNLIAESEPSNEVSIIPHVVIEPGILSTLNDTGITWSNFTTGVCEGPNISQLDCSHGRDHTDNDDTDGHAGFSFSKWDVNGVPLDSSASEWSCVKDNVTELVWELKSNVAACGTSASSHICVQDEVTGVKWEVSDNHVVCDGTLSALDHTPVKCFGAQFPSEGIIGYLVYDERLHGYSDRFNWYNTDPDSNGGSEGFTDDDGDVCFGYDVNNPASYCNTLAYVKRVNSTNFCGRNNWRLPSKMELVGLVNMNQYDPAIDIEYFPNSFSRSFWTSSPYADGSLYTWLVNFDRGTTSYYSSGGRSDLYSVRLVSDGELF